MQPPNDPLDNLLERLRRATPTQPGRIGPEVWRRIADGEASAPGAPWFVRLELVFSRPSFAATFVAACMLLGLFLAEIRLSHAQAERTARIEQNYVRLIDPLLDYAMHTENVSRRP